MGVKTYQAYTMAEALVAAKRDLGADAVILESRTFKRGGVLGIGRKNIFELTASSADRAELSTARRREGSSKRPARAALSAYGATGASSSGTTTAPCERIRTRRWAQALAETHERKRSGGGTAPATATSAAPTPVAAAEPAALPAPPAPPAPVARRFILTPADLPLSGRGGPPAAGATAVPVADESGAMQQELVAIKTMVGRVLEGQVLSHHRHKPSMPAKLFGMYLELISQDLSEELADRIVAAVRDELSAGAWEDESAVREAVLRHLAEFVPTADPPIPQRSPDGRPLTIALIGPTGVGKTTTLAKLAASFKLRLQRSVGLVTCDTYRIAAVDQLRTYANIIGIPLEVALTPDEMGRAVRSLHECDVILVDTAGRGPSDSGRLDELLQCLSAAQPHEVHLVLSSTSSERVLLQEAEAFAALGVDRIVLTKLDEAVSFGVLINVIQKVGKELSFITTGQEVPDDIEAGEARRLAELVLGAEIHQ